MKAAIVRIHAAGGPEVLAVEQVGLPAPGAGEVTIRHTAIGLNWISSWLPGFLPTPSWR